MQRFFTRHILSESYKRLSKPERALFYIASVICIISGLGLGIYFAAAHTLPVPAEGGSYTEAMIGGPRFLNPILAPANDVDRDLVKLVYAGLLRYDESGALAEDLAESFTVATDTKSFTFSLKPGLLWHDGQPLTSDDVLFTIRLMQSPEYQSPLRFAWQGVKAEKYDDRTVVFTLPSPYGPFLAHMTVGILPKHIWQNVSPQAFPFDEHNLKPIGSGPFRYKDIVQEKTGYVQSLTLSRSLNYHRKNAYLDDISIKFFEDQDGAMEAFLGRDVDGIGFGTSAEISLNGRNDIAMHVMTLPRVFAVFFNQNQSKALSQKAVREALSTATDREGLVKQLYKGQAEVLWGPLPSAVFGFTDEVAKHAYDPELAKELLDKAGWKLNDDGVREFREKQKIEKLVGNKKVTEEVVATTSLEFSLLTANIPELEEAADLLKTYWESIGARVSVEVAGVADIQGERVRPRQYDAVLFGEVLGLDPDPFSFWHSTQRRDPGLNLALYQNPKVDKLLEEARQTSDPEKRRKSLTEFQKMVSDDIPAIFLFSPKYPYPVSRTILGINTKIIATPSERFGGVTDWYMKTKRVWK